MSQFTQRQILLMSVLVAFGVLARILPHPVNFAPVGALGLLAIAYLPKRTGLLVPLLIMFFSDFFIGWHETMLFTWGSYMLIGLAGYWVLKKTKKRSVLALSGPVAAVIFFVVSNFGVWTMGTMYAHSWQGFVRCYEMALPFFTNTLLSDTGFTLGLFLLADLVVRMYTQVSTTRLGRASVS